MFSGLRCRQHADVQATPQTIKRAFAGAAVSFRALLKQTGNSARAKADRCALPLLTTESGPIEMSPRPMVTVGSGSCCLGR